LIEGQNYGDSDENNYETEKMAGFSALMLGLMMFGHSANATLVQWDLFDTFGTQADGFNTSLGTTTTYTSNFGGYDLGFAGFTDADPITDPAIATDLLENNRGDNEEGLGVASNNGEVDLNQYIVIDLGIDWDIFTNWAIDFDSLDSLETAMLGTSAHKSDILLDGAFLPIDKDDGQGWLTFIPTAQFIYFSVGSTGTPSTEDVLLHALRAEVPEPGTLIMMAMGLVLLGFSRRKSV